MGLDGTAKSGAEKEKSMARTAATAKSRGTSCSPSPSEPGDCGDRRSSCPTDGTVYQPFPDGGVLLTNLDLRKSDLHGRIGGLPGAVRSYKMISVELDDQCRLAHFGSGPNFQGGRLTLCTCAHQIRTEKKTPADWAGSWVAGFTSPRLCKKTWLFYLAQVEQGHPTAADLWNKLSGGEQQAKSTRLSRLGDAFEPNSAATYAGPHKAKYYHPPMVGHSHRATAPDERWKQDIEYSHPGFRRHAAHLVARPELTFLWQTPTLFLEHHPRNRSWASVDELLRQLIAVH
jgi:hypothetical protein